MTEHEESSELGQTPLITENSGGLLTHTPWWLMSIGIHLVLLLAATLIAIEQLHAWTDGDPEVFVRPIVPQATLFDKSEAPPGTVDRTGTIIDNPDTSSD